MHCRGPHVPRDGIHILQEELVPLQAELHGYQEEELHVLSEGLHVAARPGCYCPPYCRSTALCGLVRIKFVQLVRFSGSVPLRPCAQ